jgi:Flp pilus assembly protein TadB
VELSPRKGEVAPAGAASSKHSALTSQRSWVVDRFAGDHVDTQRTPDVENGFGDGLAKAFELVLTPAILGLAGFGLDRWLGLTPLFTIVLTLWALAVVSYMTWFRYEAEMRRMEAGAVWARPRQERR